jgi:hypothetical protein
VQCGVQSQDPILFLTLDSLEVSRRPPRVCALWTSTRASRRSGLHFAISLNVHYSLDASCTSIQAHQGLGSAYQPRNTFRTTWDRAQVGSACERRQLHWIVDLFRYYLLAWGYLAIMIGLTAHGPESG